MRALVRLLVLLVVLGVVAVVADRWAARAVERAVATHLATAGGLDAPPEVEVRGTPFLTQAVRGRYDDVVVRAEGVQAGELRVRQFVAQLRGVQVPLGEALSGDVVAVPVDALTARAVLSYADLSQAVAERGLRLSPAGGGLVRVTGSVRVLGRDLEASAVSRPELVDGAVVVTAERFEVGNEVADAVLTRALGDRLDVRLDIAALPYGLELTSLRAGGDGIVLQARSDGAVLQPLPAS
ncbi:MAG TPA: DUF2993 domain-containing protein [Mycobacteriales bacterium]|nr:DUF2993 domain-containing protein [Mycobacteriales bacterium]